MSSTDEARAGRDGRHPSFGHKKYVCGWYVNPTVIVMFLSSWLLVGAIASAYLLRLGAIFGACSGSEMLTACSSQ